MKINNLEPVFFVYDVLESYYPCKDYKNSFSYKFSEARLTCRVSFSAFSFSTIFTATSP